MTTKLPLAERLMRHSDRSQGPTSCWPWTGYIDKDGYGRVRVEGKSISAHEAAWLDAYGFIPDGPTLDHLCHGADESCPSNSTCPHRRCINLAHLEAVPHRVNVLRGRGFAARNAVKTTCAKGHAYDSLNTYVDSHGHRNCRACNRAAARGYQQRLKVAP